MELPRVPLAPDLRVLLQENERAIHLAILTTKMLVLVHLEGSLNRI